MDLRLAPTSRRLRAPSQPAHDHTEARRHAPTHPASLPGVVLFTEAEAMLCRLFHIITPALHRLHAAHHV